MNRFNSTLGALTLATLAALFLSTDRVHSQWFAQPQAAPATPIAPKSPLEALAAVKAANAALLKAQGQTLERLDALQKEADQLRIYSKRS